MKELPEHPHFSDVLAPIREAVDHFYHLRRTGKRGFNYEGYELIPH